MSLYVDTSALLKRYIDEADSDLAERYLMADAVWISARHTEVEVRRNLAKLLDGTNLQAAQAQFRADWAVMQVVELDALTCEMAATIAEVTAARTLDALHLAAASRVGIDSLNFLTFDIRQAQAARLLQMIVIGV